MPPMDLSRSDRVVLDIVLPTGAHPKLALGISETGFDAFLEDFRQTAPPHLWRAFRMGLFAGAWIAPLLVRQLPPITRLNQVDRERALAAMAASGMPELRQLVSVLKSVVSLHYGSLPAVRRAIGYP
jgi:hypothetical protein